MPEITQEEFDLLESYKKLGEPEHIVDAISERNTIKRQGAIAIAAQLYSYKPTVLDKLAKDLEISVKEDAAYVVIDGAETKLDDYANENWSDFIPSLKAEEGDKGNKGATYIVQAAGNRGGSVKKNKKSATDFIMQKYGWVLSNDSV
jgi:hypothetical protein